MKKILSLIIIIACIAVFDACSEKDGPKTALVSFFATMKNNDINTARQLCTPESKNILDLIEVSIKTTKDATAAEKFDKDNVEFIDINIIGDKAIITVKEKKSGESTSFVLIKDNEIWKVALDKSFSVDLDGEKKDISADSMKKDLDQLKNMDLDKYEESIEKSKKALDSAKAILNNEIKK